MALTREEAWQKAAYLLSVASGFDPKSKTTLTKLQQDFNNPFNAHELIFKLAVEQKYHTKVGKPLIQNESAENLFNDAALQDFADYLTQRLEYPSDTQSQAAMVGHGIDKNGNDVFQLTIKVQNSTTQLGGYNESPLREMVFLKELLYFNG